MKFDQFRLSKVKNYFVNGEKYIELHTSAKLNKDLELNNTKQILSYPQVKLVEVLNAQKSGTLKYLIESISKKSMEEICNIINEKGYKEFSEINILSYDNPSNLVLGWIIYCECK